MHIVHLDWETRSTVDLRKTGVYVYAEHPTTDIWCAAYAIGDGPVELWTPGQPVPQAVVQGAARDDVVFMAHTANFERGILAGVATPRYGWPEIQASKWRCTMAIGYAMALPGSLENMAAALGLDVRKDASGHRQMLQMAKPRKIEPDGTIIWWDDDERKQRLYRYCEQDVVVEREVYRRLVPLRAEEQELWALDQKINDRGFYVDQDMCEAAKKIVAIAAARLNDEMRHVTNGRVGAATNVNELLVFLRERGSPELTSVDKPTLEALALRDGLSDSARRAVEIRLEAAKASVAKINSLMNGCCADGRHRGSTQYHGANTGRWAGRRFQPQNLKRPDLTPEQIELALTTIRTGNIETLEMFFDRPLDIISSCIRSLVRAAPGKTLFAADFANIEGRVLAWLAGEEWKLKAFRDYDQGTGPDLYKVAYASSFNIPIGDVTGGQRQVGKVEELALGFGGGPGAFATMAKGYGVDIGAQYTAVRDSAAPWAVKEAEEGWENYGKGMMMAKSAWMAADIIKRLWRAKHPEIVEFWSTLEAGAMSAVGNPGGQVNAGPISYRVVGSFLWCRLPSGRALCYPYPNLHVTETPWGQKKMSLHYKGIDSRKQGAKWEEQYTYGGKLTENVVQAVARDILAEAMIRVEAADYPVVLHVHDEIVVEESAFNDDVDVRYHQFKQLMAQVPEWAGGLPVAVEGWVGERYRK